MPLNQGTPGALPAPGGGALPKGESVAPRRRAPP